MTAERTRLPRFVKATAGTLGAQAINMVTGAAMGILLAHGLGVEARGTYAVVVLVTTLLGQFAALGVPNASVYMIGKASFPLSTIVSSSMLQGAVFSLAAAPIGIVVLMLLPNRLLSGVTAALAWIAISTVVTQSVSVQVRHIHLGRRAISIYNGLLVAESVFLCGAVGIAALGRLTLGEAIVAYAAALALSACLHLWSLRWLPDALSLEAVDREAVRFGIRFGWKLWLAGLGGMIGERGLVLVLGIVDGPAATGMYAVALAIPSLAANLPNAIAAMTYPWVANTTDVAASQRMAARILPVTIALTALVALPAIVFARPLVEFLYGAEFGGAALAMQIIMAGTIVSSVSAVLYNQLAGQGAPGYGALLVAIQLVVLGVATVTLVPWYAVEGAAVAKTVAAFAGSGYLIWASARLTGSARLFGIRETREDWRLLFRSAANSVGWRR
jgi:O-antigen/teichoic acid export membrane protein